MGRYGSIWFFRTPSMAGVRNFNFSPLWLYNLLIGYCRTADYRVFLMKPQFFVFLIWDTSWKSSNPSENSFNTFVCHWIYHGRCNWFSSWTRYEQFSFMRSDLLIEDDVESRNRPSPRILSLDGGGKRGVSALFIRDIMRWIEIEKGVHRTPKPCGWRHQYR